MGTCQGQGLDSLVNQFDNNVNITSDSVVADDNGGSSSRLPLRPHAGDCPLYLKSGTCKYGFICKFNHPAKRPIRAWADKNYKEDEEYDEDDEYEDDDEDDDKELLREDQSRKVQCKYYFSSGGCKYGQSCRYSHFKANSSFMNLNFIGLPIRWGKKECPYYMRTGSCGYGLSCRFNHPNPTTCTRSDMYNQNLAPQGVLQSFEDSGYQVPSYFQESDMDYHPTPALSSFTEMGELALQVEEFSQRPGQPNCEYFMKTGGCKFKSACWYHHPKFQPVITDVLNDKGLPLRPGRKVCWHYENCGICKYGPSCLFDHP